MIFPTVLFSVSYVDKTTFLKEDESKNLLCNLSYETDNILLRSDSIEETDFQGRTKYSSTV